MRRITNATRVLACGIALVGLWAPSAPSEAAATWLVSTIKWVYPQADGSFVLTFAADPPTCTSASSPKYLLVMAGQNGVTADGVKSMLATSLAAFAMGAQVQINFDDATSNCYVNRLVVFAP